MKQYLIILLLATLIAPYNVRAFTELQPSFPRLANYFLHWTISDKEAEELAKFDLVILDAEIQERSRAQLELLRNLNPDIILLAYVPASEIRRDIETLKSIAPLRYKLGTNILSEWYLRNAKGELMSFWPGAWIVNVADEAMRTTLSGAPADAQRPVLSWNEYLPEFVTNEILNTGLWDGIFYDNAWDDIIHFAKGVPDLDHNGAADDPVIARSLWRNGLKKIYSQTIALNPDKLVFENDGPMYASEAQGVLLENFPRKNWVWYMEELKKIQRDAKDPSIAILNANTFNTGQRNNYRAMRYGLTTALISNAYFSFDFGDQDHGQTWWYDEYDVFLGEPIEEARPLSRAVPLSAWQRNFERGIVFVNSSDTPRLIKLPLEVEKIRGAQDAIVNDGLITQQLTVGAKDGLVALRPLERILGAVYENGIFARVFSAQGQTTRAGFFAFDKTEKSGIMTAVADLDGDQKNDKIKFSNDGLIRIVLSNGKNISFYPFGDNWKGQISVDIGDVNHDGVMEIVVAGGKIGGMSISQARVYRFDGTLITLPFYPFGSNYRGEINVATGDLNGDGFSEIVVGAGAGGGPQVRIFAGDGRLLSGGFFAYDPRFRGGVRVAVGDIDGDGKAEIITGPGAGGGPQVRIFNNKGQPFSAGFFAFDHASRAGVIPLVVDVDGDGKNEILAVTKEML